MEWEKLASGDIWSPQKSGDTLEGEVIACETGGSYGPQWVIKTVDGKIAKTPSHKVLQSRMSLVKPGDHIKIVAGSKELPKVKGHHETQLYEVYRARQ